MPTQQQFEKYLDQLISEIEAFPDDSSLWEVLPGISNSPGNLGLHIAGNIQHFIGAVIGKSGYVRHRDEEFSVKGLKKKEVVAELHKARTIITTVLSDLSPEKQLEPYPDDFKGRSVPMYEALSHLFAHLAYHTGQVNYFRRIVTAR
ncbi:MAG: DinB family protein [Bacteroidia bacterium]